MSIYGVLVSARPCAKHFAYINSSSQCPANTNEGLVVQCSCLRSLGPSEILIHRLPCLQEVVDLSKVEQRVKASEPNYFITHFLNCVGNAHSKLLLISRADTRGRSLRAAVVGWREQHSEKEITFQPYFTGLYQTDSHISSWTIFICTGRERRVQRRVPTLPRTTEALPLLNLTPLEWEEVAHTQSGIGCPLLCLLKFCGWEGKQYVGLVDIFLLRKCTTVGKLSALH